MLVPHLSTYLHKRCEQTPGDGNRDLVFRMRGHDVAILEIFNCRRDGPFNCRSSQSDFIRTRYSHLAPSATPSRAANKPMLRFLPVISVTFRYSHSMHEWTFGRIDVTGDFCRGELGQNSPEK